jgi:hypothetical protein
MSCPPAFVFLVGKNAATVGGDVAPYMTVRSMVSRELTGSGSDADSPDAKTDNANYGCLIAAASLIARSKVSNARLSGVVWHHGTHCLHLRHIAGRPMRVNRRAPGI